MPSLYLYKLALLLYIYSLLRLALDLETVISQKALLLKEVGKLLVIGDCPILQPGKNQLLVKVLVVGCKF